MRWLDLTDDPNGAEALDYRRTALHKAYAPPVGDRAGYLASLAAGRRVLDIGVADHVWEDGGKSFQLHRCLAASAADIVGVDILPAAIATLRAEGLAAVEADVCTDNFPTLVGGGWEVIIAGEVIEHLGDIDSMMANVAAVLVPGGRLVLTTPNPYCLRLVTAYLRGRIVENVDHLTYWFPSGIAELADRCGFRLVRYRGVISEVTGSRTRRTLSRLVAATVLVPESACWTMVYELEAASEPEGTDERRVMR